MIITLLLVLLALAPDKPRPAKRRERGTTLQRRLIAIRKQTKRATLALIEMYYPQPRRARVLRCCNNQRAGNFKLNCRDRLCPPCAARESHVNAQQEFDTFWRFSLRPWPVIVQEVHTLPPELHIHVETPEGYRAWRRASLKTLTDLYGPHIGGAAHLHPLGDKNLTKTHYHFDIILNAYKLTPQAITLDAFDLRYDTGREIYRRNLEDAFGVSVRDEIDAWFGPPKRRVGGMYAAWRVIKYSARHVYQPAFARHVPGKMRDWKYKPKRREMALTFPGADVIKTLLHVEDAFYGQPRRYWFGYLKDKARKKADARFVDERQRRRHSGETEADADDAEAVE